MLGSTNKALGIRGIATAECGQALVELVVLIPAIVTALVLATNVLLFVSECARFDRSVCEYARANAGIPGNPSSTQGLPASAITGYTTRGRFSVSVLIQSDLWSPFDTREHVFTLRYRMFTIPALEWLGLPNSMTLTRTKSVIVPHYRAAAKL